MNLLLNETIEDDFLSISGIEEVFVRSDDKGLSQIEQGSSMDSAKIPEGILSRTDFA